MEYQQHSNEGATPTLQELLTILEAEIQAFAPVHQYLWERHRITPFCISLQLDVTWGSEMVWAVAQCDAKLIIFDHSESEFATVHVYDDQGYRFDGLYGSLADTLTIVCK